MKKRLLSLLLALAMVFSLMPAALAADKPSFQSFFESVPANAETEPGSPNSTNKWKVASLDGDYVLTNDIDLSGSDWTPIGGSGGSQYALVSGERVFNGTFDGAGHVISGLTIQCCLLYTSPSPRD